MSLRRRPTELEQREHLAVRFGLIRRRDPGPAAVRIVRSAGLRRALEVPYYALLHHGNAVPRSELQPLKSVPAWYVDVPGAP